MHHRRAQATGRLAAAGGLIALLAFAIAAGRAGMPALHPRAFQLLYALGFAGYVLVVRAICRQTMKPGQGNGCSTSEHAAATNEIESQCTVDREYRMSRPFAGLLPVAVVLVRVFLVSGSASDDLHRYVWEGRIQWAGWNPYAVAPDDIRLTPLRDSAWRSITHPGMTTIYPPLSQLVFALIAWVSPTVMAMKIFAMAADLAACVLLAGWLRACGRPIAWVSIYALSPLVLTAFALQGHIDSLMLACVAGAGWSAARGRRFTAGVCIALAVLAKTMAMPLLVWLAFRHRRAAVLSAAIIVAGYLPYASAGTGLFRTLVRFGTGDFFNSLLAEQMYPMLANGSVRILFAALFTAYTLYTAARRFDMAEFGLRVFGTMLILMPVVHYWYVAWVLLFAVHRLHWRWVALSGSMLFYFDTDAVHLATGKWRLPEWSRKLIWMPFVAVWLWEAMRGKRETENER